ncbi:MAG: DNA-binding protein [Candidatus Nanohaloarchaea archaeon]
MSEEKDIEELREQRKEDLEKGQDPEKAREQQRNQIKQQAGRFLTSEASSRLGNIRAADPDRAAAIEMQIARMAKARGMGGNSITVKMLEDMLRSLKQEKEKNESDLKFRRG